MNKNKITTRISLRGSAAFRSLLEQLALGVLKAERLLKDPDVTLFQTPDGTLLEIYGQGFFNAQPVFDNSYAILNFKVDDIETSVNHMLSMGAKTEIGIVRVSDVYAYCHLTLDEVYIVGLYQEG